MADKDGPAQPPGETTQFIEKMDGLLLGWEQPAARLRAALAHDHFRLYAQPIVVLADPGGIAMAEVLVRLREEGNAEAARMLPPGDFLPAFEHYRILRGGRCSTARRSLGSRRTGGSRRVA